MLSSRYAQGRRCCAGRGRRCRDLRSGGRGRRPASLDPRYSKIFQVFRVSFPKIIHWETQKLTSKSRLLGSIPGQIGGAKQGLHGISTLVHAEELGLTHCGTSAQRISQVLIRLHGIMTMARHGTGNGKVQRGSLLVFWCILFSCLKRLKAGSF